MNPVIAGYISYSDVVNGNLNLFDFFIMNKVLQYKNKYEEVQIGCLKA